MKAQEPFPYVEADYEKVICNLCGRADSLLLARRDRNGLPVQTCICRHCGLIYINPRMTAGWYGRYYEHEYRAQMARFRNEPVRPPDYDQMFQRARGHGVELARHYGIHFEPGLTVEVGSSVGGVLAGIREQLGGEILGIEPSPDESEFSRKQGVPTFTTSIEDFRETITAPANIVCTQSLNHFLNPAFFLKWAHETLRPGGRLILEVMNFRQVFRRFGWMPRAVQIDHTYMFVPEVLREFVRSAGFDLILDESSEWKTEQERTERREKGIPKYHMVLIAAKGDRRPFSTHGEIPAQFEAVRRSLREVPSSPRRYFFRFGYKRLTKKWAAKFGL